jgi:hypothetical protein
MVPMMRVFPVKAKLLNNKILQLSTKSEKCFKALTVSDQE